MQIKLLVLGEESIQLNMFRFKFCIILYLDNVSSTISKQNYGH